MQLYTLPISGQKFTMPAESDRHDCCWMAWPVRHELWGQRMKQVRREHALVARTIARFEPVVMVCRSEDAGEVQSLCGNGITIWPAMIDDSWMRDSGPTFVRGDLGGLAVVDWRFNAWGSKYAPYKSDAALKRNLAEVLGVPLVRTKLVSEGGAILSDGDGTIITTESCLLNPNRNAGMTREEVEVELLEALGAEKIVWLPGDLAEVETDGHIDCLASIVAPGRVMLEDPATERGARAEVLAENRRALQSQTDARGRRFDIIDMVAAPRISAIDRRHQASYLNFYLPNGAAVMAAHGVPSDADAKAVVAAAFPDREVVQLRLEALPYGGGSIHCITQHQPSRESWPRSSAAAMPGRIAGSARGAATAM